MIRYFRGTVKPFYTTCLGTPNSARQRDSHIEMLAQAMDDRHADPEARQWRLQWAIGIYAGGSPLTVAPRTQPDAPVLTAADVTDLDAFGVADPFFLQAQGRIYLFFEVLNRATDRGEIAYATSSDGLDWTYGAVALREPFHLSYPFVFAHGGDFYMIPETRQAQAVRLYRADRFPAGWRCVGELLTGPFADSTLIFHEGRWWLFAERGLDELRLFHSRDFTGGWVEHPASPLWPGNRRYSRPGGRIVAADGRLLRFAQDGWPTYGSRLHAFAIDALTPTAYAEHLCPESPILAATGAGWNALAMHHLDALEVAPGKWLAAVDGASIGLA